MSTIFIIKDRKKECEKLREEILENKILVMKGDMGSGKKTLVNQYRLHYKSKYELVWIMTDFNFLLAGWKTQFQMCFPDLWKENSGDLKKFLLNSKLKYVLFVGIMPQFKQDEFLEILKTYIPMNPDELSPGQHIVIQSNTDIEGYKSYEIEKFNIEDSLSLIRYHFGDEKKLSDNDLVSLTDICDGNPKMMEMTTTYIKQVYPKEENCSEFLDALKVSDNKVKSFYKILHQKE
ncbi:hypothetical protein DLAC_10783 [Tieghemostelium lacteum]|uniref:Uncharacterized protein n=1 Tax=Tieghemostelium lacteum TaxID=361077 RepID=A0A151Z461_TIELA|nr:hypothetical protein DLAC_10783 [Tieghemostelium lacteum]|eukprot:KYQ88752.1 hypothetical protein DLAC_10783 [Tieghemostelium lacteum]